MIKQFLLLILSIVILAGCSTTITPDSSTFNVSHTPKPSDMLVAISSTPSAMAQTTSVTASLTPEILKTKTPALTMDTTPTFTTTTIAEFPRPDPSSGVSQQCLNIGNTLPTGMVLTGTMILDAGQFKSDDKEGVVYLLDLSDRDISLMSELSLSTNKLPTYNNISPDRKWFYYFEPSSSGAGSQLHISSVDGQEQSVAYWNEMWGQVVYWLDSQRLIIWPPVDDLHPYGFAFILNPFSGEYQALPPKFSSGLNSLVLAVDYNPSLTRAVYLSGNYYILWDTQSQLDLWKKRGANYSYLLRGWSSNGNQFAYVVTNEDAKQSDIFLITPDGIETQLTHLAEAYPSVSEIYIEDMAWSPDGRYLAFITKVKDVDLYDMEGPTLMVVDVATQQVTDFCIVVSRYSGGHLIWSPTSQQVIVASPIDYQEYIKNASKGPAVPVEVVLVDIINKTATKLTENMAPVGWMIEP